MIVNVDLNEKEFDILVKLLNYPINAGLKETSEDYRTLKSLTNKIIDEDGDYGIVKCGKCGLEMFRKDAFLDNDYVYVDQDCLEEIIA